MSWLDHGRPTAAQAVTVRFGAGPGRAGPEERQLLSDQIRTAVSRRRCRRPPVSPAAGRRWWWLVVAAGRVGPFVGPVRVGVGVVVAEGVAGRVGQGVQIG